MKRSEVFKSQWLRCEDLAGKPIVLQITAAAYEALKSPDGKEQQKTVLSFRGTSKRLPLNLTNWDAVAGITGCDDSDGWIGHSIELYPTVTTLGNKTVPCIRARSPRQRELPHAQPQPQPQPQPTPPAAAVTGNGNGSLSSDLDDTVPF